MMNYPNSALLQETYDNSPYLGLKSPKMGPIYGGGMVQPPIQPPINYQNSNIYEKHQKPQPIQNVSLIYPGNFPNYQAGLSFNPNFLPNNYNMQPISESRIINPQVHELPPPEYLPPQINSSVVYATDRPMRMIDTSSRHRSVSPILSPRSFNNHHPPIERVRNFESNPIYNGEPPETRYRYYEPEFYPTVFGPRSFELESRRQNEYFATPFGLFRNYSLKKNMFSSSNNSAGAGSSINHSRIQSAGSYIRKYNENEPMGGSYQNFGKSDIDEILDVFKEQLAMEINLENLKQDLGRQPDFKVIDLFFMFDQNQTGQITLGEFQQGLGIFGIKADYSDVRLLVRRYSRDGNERMSYDEFAKIFVPLKYMRGISRETALKNKQFNYETKNLISKLLKTHLNTEYSSELIRNEIVGKGIDLRRVFSIIDASQGGLITVDELKRFLERSGFNVAPYEVELLLFRYDRNLSGKLSLQEFVYEFNPVQVVPQTNYSQQRPNTTSYRKNDIEEFIEISREHLNMDLTLESYKQDLSKQSDFKVIDLFLLFDDNATGQVILAEFASGMEIFGIKPDFNEVRLIMKRYSNDGNEKLSFEEFARIFIPVKGLMRSITKDGGAKRKQFSSETKSIIGKLLRGHLENERRSEKIRRDVRSKGIDLKAIFERIDTNQGKILTADEIKRFLERNGLNVNLSEAEVLLYRYDRNYSGKLNIQEFLYEFNPRL